ncbi:Hypothetical protein CGLY_07360 [Corynebacterium glyciniphilum AJ 3170]|uniref:Uncharacterized protein n=1 Tax=Corynebacterium glyciniphilum AJ 3170 TaxID=1404245 RepID=X5DTD1_9CORY|nr:hypothetical protein [Corynebacterium glyciniphilum]AHW63917.1 Hypothetical protein CGLY_07360 [Corynebacterium glyciniphilum AJ 3170]
MADLFAPGDLTRDGFFALPDEDDTVAVPDSPTMSRKAVAKYLGVSPRAVEVAARKHEIRRTSPGLYLTSSVTAHRPARAVCSTAQLLSVLGVSPAWWQANGSRLKIAADPVVGLPRWVKVDVNRLATALRAGTGAA